MSVSHFWKWLDKTHSFVGWGHNTTFFSMKYCSLLAMQIIFVYILFMLSPRWLQVVGDRIVQSPHLWAIIICVFQYIYLSCYRCVNNFVFIATSFLIYIICKCTSAGIYFWRISCSFWVINLVYFLHWTQVHGYSVFWIYIIRHWSIHSAILWGMRKISIWLRLDLWANPKIWWSLCLVNIRISEWLKDLILFRFRKYITWFAWSVKHGQSGFFSLHQVWKVLLN